VPGTTSKPTLDLDVSGMATVNESGITIVSAPEGVTFEPLPADYPAELVPEDDKFASRTSRAGSTVCSCACRRASSSKADVCAGDVERRLALLADGCRCGEGRASR
jgi:hypothetical protein